jgi:hypothetical protein
MIGLYAVHNRISPLKKNRSISGILILILTIDSTYNFINFYWFSHCLLFIDSLH